MFDTIYAAEYAHTARAEQAAQAAEIRRIALERRTGRSGLAVVTDWFTSRTHRAPAPTARTAH